MGDSVHVAGEAGKAVGVWVPVCCEKGGGGLSSCFAVPRCLPNNSPSVRGHERNAGGRLGRVWSGPSRLAFSRPGRAPLHQIGGGGVCVCYVFSSPPELWPACLSRSSSDAIPVLTRDRWVQCLGPSDNFVLLLLLPFRRYRFSCCFMLLYHATTTMSTYKIKLTYYERISYLIY